MPFNPDLPAEGEIPWYTPFQARWFALAGFVNQLEVGLAQVSAGGGGGASPAYVQSAIQAHREEATPHDAYDEDIPSLSILFQNGTT